MSGRPIREGPAGAGRPADTEHRRVLVLAAHRHRRGRLPRRHDRRQAQLRDPPGRDRVPADGAAVPDHQAAAPGRAAAHLRHLADHAGGAGVHRGIGFLIGNRANEEFPGLVAQIQQTARDVQNWLLTGPLHLREAQIADFVDDLTRQLNEQRSQITDTVLTGATALVEVLAAIVLLLFVTFFLLKDGDRIWAWFLRAFGGAADRVDRAGRAAWRTLSHYVLGTVAVAAVHAVVIGIVLAGMRVPLWAPLAVLIFFASFIPIVGIFFAGGVATLVVFGSQGWVYALIFVGVLVVEQQLENHVLQPLIVGRALEFHPLAIIIVLAVGGVIGGIAGAVVAVPVTAVIYRALPELRRDRPEEPPRMIGPTPPEPEPSPGAGDAVPGGPNR